MTVNNYRKILDSNSRVNEEEVVSYLKDHCYSFPKKEKEISDVVKSQIENILGYDTALSNLMLIMYKYNIIGINDIAIKNYDREKELKIFNVDKKKLIKRLRNSPKESSYRAIINDDYFEYPDLSLKDGKYTNGEKSTIRTRKKELISVNRESFDNNPIKNFCTLKKEYINNLSEELKDVYEFEFDLFHPDHFNYLIRAVGLEHYKSKVKERVSFLINKELTIDIDTYNINDNNLRWLGDDEMKKMIKNTRNKSVYQGNTKLIIDKLKNQIEVVAVEMEVPREELLESALRFVGLEDVSKNPRSTGGFGKMFHYHGLKVKKHISKKS